MSLNSAVAADAELRRLRIQIDDFLKLIPLPAVPSTLYDPIRYVIHSPGKRIRPLLTLISGLMAGGEEEKLMPLAAAIEIFHNFTLVHDDIMDNASERRGNATVHTKWDQNVAILSGDMMVGMAYDLLIKAETPHLRDVLSVFQESVDAVCEGQALDKEFENRAQVTIPEYLEMIEKKTGWLISSALRLGWVSVRGNDEVAGQLHRLAMAMGRGFQIQDDYLDLMADQAAFGKRIGGDIVEGKRTYLVLCGASSENEDTRNLVSRIMNREIGFDGIKQVRQSFEHSGVLAETDRAINSHFEETAERLNTLIDYPGFSLLKHQVELVLNRTF